MVAVTPANGSENRSQWNDLFYHNSNRALERPRSFMKITSFVVDNGKIDPLFKILCTFRSFLIFYVAATSCIGESTAPCPHFSPASLQITDMRSVTYTVGS